MDEEKNSATEFKPYSEAVCAVKDKRFNDFFAGICEGLAVMAKKLGEVGFPVGSFIVSEPVPTFRISHEFVLRKFMASGKLTFESDKIRDVGFEFTRPLDPRQQGSFCLTSANDIKMAPRTFSIAEPADPETWLWNGQPVLDYLFESLPFTAVRPAMYMVFKGREKQFAAEQPKAE